MIVTTKNMVQVVDQLAKYTHLSLDTETSGLRPYHGDRLFSLIIGARTKAGVQGAYFNFQEYATNPDEEIFRRVELKYLNIKLFSDPTKHWYLHKAKFDMHILAQENIELAGTIHCTQALARVEYNDHMSYSLASCAERIGEKKDEAVEKYISEHKLWEWEEIPGKSVRRKNLFYSQVPFDIIAPYGIRDAQVTYSLGEHQTKAIQRLDDDSPPGMPRLLAVAENEKRLTKTVFRMERLGLTADTDYCVRAARYETDRAETAGKEFKKLTGRSYSASPKLFAEIFAGFKPQWKFTDKGNPSFESDVLKKFDSPVAREILVIRDAKSKSDFYHGFIYHTDANGKVHPDLNPAGTGSGRFSSSDPNFQNLTNEEGEEGEFLVRRAIIPTPGFCFFMPDWSAMEYRMMLDLAGRIWGSETALIREVQAGKDVHQATADLVKSVSGIDIGRSKAKNGNFAKLYGAGLKRLAETLKCDLAGAQAVSDAIEKAAPEIAQFCSQVIQTAERRGYIFNWMGRRSYFPNSRLAYKAPNYLIQGGCADVVKVVMNKVDDYLEDKTSRMVLSVHDELVLEVAESELHTVPKEVHRIMETTYPHRYLQLLASAEYSWKSLADKEKGFPA